MENMEVEGGSELPEPALLGGGRWGRRSQQALVVAL